MLKELILQFGNFEINLESYLKFGDDLIMVAEKYLPGLSKHIVFREDASPSSFFKYVGTTNGAIYGLAIDDWKPPTKTIIKGLYLTGAGTSARPGVEDAFHSGLTVAKEIYSKENFVNKITSRTTS